MTVAANLIIAVPFSQYYIWNTRCFLYVHVQLLMYNFGFAIKVHYWLNTNEAEKTSTVGQRV